MGRAIVMQKVRSSIEGLEIRNQMRDAARHAANQTASVQIARRRGRLRSLEEALDWLTGSGLLFTTEEYYGVTIVNSCGVTLAYGPDGRLQWNTRQRDESIQDTFEFTDEPCGTSSASSGCDTPLPEPRSIESR